MKNYVLRHAALLVATVLLSTSFWSCSKDEEPVPEPTPPVVMSNDRLRRLFTYIVPAVSS